MEIIWSQTANQDLKDIYNYISKDSWYYSKKTITNIIDLSYNLVILPYIGRKIPEYNEKEKREIIYKSYRIMYKIRFNGILINRVWHSSRLVTKKLIS